MLTCDPANRGGRLSILVRDGRIVDIAPAASSFAALYPTATVVDASSRLITPGFVDAHQHGESFALRFLTGRHPFSAWPTLNALRSAMDTLLNPAATRLVGDLYLAAGAVHLLNGTTTVSEFLPPYGVEGMAAARTGLERSGVRHAAVLQTWEQVAATQPHPTDVWRSAISLGREDQFTVYSFENLLRAARDLQCALVAHAGETRKDVEALRRNFKKGPLAVLRECGALKPGTQFLHANHFGPSDIGGIREAGGTITLCAASAAAKRTGYPLLTLLDEHDVRLCLGTDWGGAGILREMRFLRQLPRFAQGVRSFTSEELLRMATINGAHALGCSQITGSLEPGKRADLITFALDDPRLPVMDGDCPPQALADALVDHISPEAICDVMVDGVFHVRDGQMTRMGLQGLRTSIRSIHERLHIAPAGHPDAITPKKADTVVSAAREQFIDGEQESQPRVESVPVTRANLEPPPAPQEGPSPKLPELSRTVKKVFGEDEF